MTLSRCKSLISSRQMVFWMLQEVIKTCAIPGVSIPVVGTGVAPVGIAVDASELVKSRGVELSPSFDSSATAESAERDSMRREAIIHL